MLGFALVRGLFFLIKRGVNRRDFKSRCLLRLKQDLTFLALQQSILRQTAGSEPKQSDTASREQ